VPGEGESAWRAGWLAHACRRGTPRHTRRVMPAIHTGVKGANGLDGPGRAALDTALLGEVTRRSFGPVAQLGARLNGIQKVSGSIPLRSTSSQ
jgi:hypothetical protein